MNTSSNANDVLGSKKRSVPLSSKFEPSRIPRPRGHEPIPVRSVEARRQQTPSVVACSYPTPPPDQPQLERVKRSGEIVTRHSGNLARSVLEDLKTSRQESRTATQQVRERLQPDSRKGQEILPQNNFFEGLQEEQPCGILQEEQSDSYVATPLQETRNIISDEPLERSVLRQAREKRERELEKTARLKLNDDHETQLPHDDTRTNSETAEKLAYNFQQADTTQHKHQEKKGSRFGSVDDSAGRSQVISPGQAISSPQSPGPGLFAIATRETSNPPWGKTGSRWSTKSRADSANHAIPRLPRFPQLPRTSLPPSSGTSPRIVATAEEWKPRLDEFTDNCQKQRRHLEGTEATASYRQHQGPVPLQVDRAELGARPGRSKGPSERKRKYGSTESSSPPCADSSSFTYHGRHMKAQPEKDTGWKGDRWLHTEHNLGGRGSTSQPLGPSGSPSYCDSSTNSGKVDRYSRLGAPTEDDCLESSRFPRTESPLHIDTNAAPDEDYRITASLGSSSSAGFSPYHMRRAGDKRISDACVSAQFPFQERASPSNANFDEQQAPSSRRVRTRKSKGDSNLESKLTTSSLPTASLFHGTQQVPRGRIAAQRRQEPPRAPSLHELDDSPYVRAASHSGLDQVESRGNKHADSRPGRFKEPFMEHSDSGNEVEVEERGHAHVERSDGDVIPTEVLWWLLQRNIRDIEEWRIDEGLLRADEARKLVEELERKQVEAAHLAEEVERKQAEADQLAEEVERKQAEADQLAEEVERKQVEADQLAEEVERKQAEAAQLAEEVVERRKEARLANKRVADLEEEAKRKDIELKKSQEEITRQRRALLEQESKKARQIAQTMTDVQEKQAKLSRLEDHHYRERRIREREALYLLEKDDRRRDSNNTRPGILPPLNMTIQFSTTTILSPRPLSNTSSDFSLSDNERIFQHKQQYHLEQSRPGTLFPVPLELHSDKFELSSGEKAYPTSRPSRPAP